MVKRKKAIKQEIKYLKCTNDDCNFHCMITDHLDSSRYCPDCTIRMIECNEEEYETWLSMIYLLSQEYEDEEE